MGWSIYSNPLLKTENKKGSNLYIFCVISSFRALVAKKYLATRAPRHKGAPRNTKKNIICKFMKDLEYIHFECQESFRNWLQENHDLSPGIWIIFYKPPINIKTIKYDEALDEALCFGWIDSLIKKIDQNKYVRKFTPRTDTTKWSDINKKKVLTLIEKGNMTAIGLNKIDIYLKTGKVDWENQTKKPEKTDELNIPDFIIEALAQNEPALTNFNNLAPSHKKHYILWITQPKGQDTRNKRVLEAIKLLLEKRKLGLK